MSLSLDRLIGLDQHFFLGWGYIFHEEMNEDNEVDISDVMRQRTSREEVRRRNREIMERANAELREGKSAPDAGKSIGAKDSSRFSLIRQSREGTQTFWAPYEFKTSMPELVFGPLKVDLDVDAATFAAFNRDAVRPLFFECLKNTCLVDPSMMTHLDLVNPEEAFAPATGGVDPLDEPLLTNELMTVQVENPNADGVYTGHFLRKPQLMSNDLFTEGNRNVGFIMNKFTIPKGAHKVADGEFEAVKVIDDEVTKSSRVFNPITKKTMGVKRILSVFPDQSTAKLAQYKFDDRTVDASIFSSVLDRDLSLYENAAMVVEDKRPISFTASFSKKRRFIQTNRGNAATGHDAYYLLSIASSESQKATLKQIGSKAVLKKDTSGPVENVQLSVVAAVTPRQEPI